MNTNPTSTAEQSLQRLFRKRFGLALISYLLIGSIVWLAMLVGLVTFPVDRAVLVVSATTLSQLVFLGLFFSNLNLRFKDPSLTLPQVLVGLVWVTVLLLMFNEVRGSMLVLYCPVLLFGVFQLRPQAFAGCALFAFAGFVAVNLYDAYTLQSRDLRWTLIQACMLAAVLIWLCLFASYIYAMRRRMQQRRMDLRAHQDTLQDMMRKLADQAATDELTGLYNRRHFLQLASKAKECLQPDRQHGLALIDLDFFKKINDVHGHAAGDRVLQLFAAVAQACLREGDVLARYGGEEFVLLLPNTDADQFGACCERLRKAFCNADTLGLEIDSLSLSIGMTLLNPDDEIESALQRADEALYRAKREGRNRCAATWESSLD